MGAGTGVRQPLASPESAVRLMRGWCAEKKQASFSREKTIPRWRYRRRSIFLDHVASTGDIIGQKDGAHPKKLIGLHDDRR